MLHCMLDLDDVLVDFIGSAHRFHNMPFDLDNYPYTRGMWEILDDEEVLGMPRSEWWDALDHNFWECLPWTEDGKEILSLVEEAFGKENVTLLTASPIHPDAHSGKYAWILREMNDYRKNYLIGAVKYRCAMPDAVLIDDREKNVEEFIAAGGQAILVPRMWNSLHGLNAVDYLRSACSDKRLYQRCL